MCFAFIYYTPVDGRELETGFVSSTDVFYAECLKSTSADASEVNSDGASSFHGNVSNSECTKGLLVHPFFKEN